MAVDIADASSRIFDSALGEFKLACDMICMQHSGKCESNIELLFLAGCEIYNLCYQTDGRTIFDIAEKNCQEVDRSRASITVVPQFQWNNFRIDFCLYSKLPTPLFIECDGHDFHERTKEQAERDRSKDRMIQEAGIPILRFTGRELYRDPMDCVLQVAKFINSRARA